MTYESYLEELREAIRHVHGVDSDHVRTIAVKETSQGTTVWDGLVELFKLKAHPNARYAYAWAHDRDDTEHPRHHITVLEVHPIKSAQDAVRAAIVQESTLNRPNKKPASASGRIVPVRFKAEELRAMKAAAKASNQTISEWVRRTIHDTLNL